MSLVLGAGKLFAEQWLFQIAVFAVAFPQPGKPCNHFLGYMFGGWPVSGGLGVLQSGMYGQVMAFKGHQLARWRKQNM